jgi:hypothetical protein
MRLFFWRKKVREPNGSEAAPAVSSQKSLPSVPSISSVASVITKPERTREEVQDGILRFALDVFRAQDARVRVESADMLSTVSPEGVVTQYTASPGLARQQSGTRLLVPGGTELDALMEQCAANGAVVSLSLPARAKAHQVIAARLRAPVHDCGSCMSPARGDGPPCEKCPARDGAVIITGLRDPIKIRVLDITRETTVEFGFRLGWSDRQGRSDEWQRFGVAPRHGARMRPLSEDELDFATLEPGPLLDRHALDATYALAQDLLRPSLEAGAAFLRLRAESEYQRRLEDLRNTFDARAREEPERAEALRDVLRREMTRLAEAYSVRVAAELDSVCLISSPVARVAVETQHGTEIEVAVDLGRAEAIPVPCVRCKANVRFGMLLRDGGIVCSTCSARGGEAGDRQEVESGQDDLVVDHLERMTPPIWTQFVTWLLDQEHMRVERSYWSGNLLVAHGSMDDKAAVAGAVRLERGWHLRAHDVQRFAALCVNLDAAVKVLLSPAPPATEAVETANALGIRLVAGETLATRLAAATYAHMHAQERARAEVERRAAVAAEIRSLGLEGVVAIESRLAQASAGSPLRGRAAIAEAVSAVSDAYKTFQRASLAWETWLEDWAGEFGALPERDASLAILADVAQLEELRQREENLLLATDDPIKVLAGTVIAGELGYTAWRSAISEAVIARCEWLRWQLQAVDPAQWRDFAAAHDEAAATRALEVRTAAIHAEARVLKAYTDLARRARLGEK